MCEDLLWNRTPGHSVPKVFMMNNNSEMSLLLHTSPSLNTSTLVKWQKNSWCFQHRTNQTLSTSAWQCQIRAGSRSVPVRLSSLSRTCLWKVRTQCQHSARLLCILIVITLLKWDIMNFSSFKKKKENSFKGVSGHLLRNLFFLGLKITLPTQSFQTTEEYCWVMVNALLVALKGFHSATTAYLNSH